MTLKFWVKLKYIFLCISGCLYVPKVFLVFCVTFFKVKKRKYLDIPIEIMRAGSAKENVCFFHSFWCTILVIYNEGVKRFLFKFFRYVWQGVYIKGRVVYTLLRHICTARKPALKNFSPTRKIPNLCLQSLLFFL